MSYLNYKSPLLLLVLMSFAGLLPGCSLDLENIDKITQASTSEIQTLGDFPIGMRALMTPTALNVSLDRKYLYVADVYGYSIRKFNFSLMEQYQ